MTIIKLQKSKSTGEEVKYLFIISFILALLATITVGAINILLAEQDPQITVFVACDVIVWFFWLSYFITLLANLVARLHIAFKDSKFKMSRNNKCLFGIIFILLFLICIAFAVGILLQYYYHTFGDYSIMDLKAVEYRIIMGIPFFFIFFIGSAVSIRLFVGNVFELTTMQSVSSCDLDMNAKDTVARDVPLSARQQTILHLSAKYISLFYVASLSTILFVTLSLTHLKFVGLFTSIDICINLLCLHLQFNFAQKQYEKCCCCWDACCTALVHRRAKKSIFKECKSNAMPIPLSSEPFESEEDEDIKNDDEDTNTDPLIEKSDGN